MRLLKPNVDRMAAQGNVPGLLTVLGDRDPELRDRARAAIVEIGASGIEALCAALRGGVWRADAAHLLGLIRAENAVPALCEALGDDAAVVRQAAAEALARIGDPRAADPLCGVLEDRVPEVRVAAAAALAMLGDKRAVRPLCGLLDTPYYGVFRTAAEALGLLGQLRAPCIAVALLRHLDSKDAGKVITVIEALGRLGDTHAVEPLLPFLTHGDYVEDAAKALGCLGDPRAVEPLCESLRMWEGDILSDVRVGSIVEALGRIGDARAVNALQRLARGDYSAHLRKAADDALSRIQGTPGATGSE